jgi:hypothetical protein
MVAKVAQCYFLSKFTYVNDICKYCGFKKSTCHLVMRSWVYADQAVFCNLCYLSIANGFCFCGENLSFFDKKL